MKTTTAHLAREITRSSSIQSYYTACLLVDKDLIDDCCRAYGYFRWADDEIDLNLTSKKDRVAFIERQKYIIDQLYLGEHLVNLCPEEEIIADLIREDRGDNSGLQSFIRNFMTILEFDASRKGNPINRFELQWYSECLGKAVTDAIQYFVGNGHPYSKDPGKYLAATAAHITHMLRDYVSDLDEGYINIPHEYLLAHSIQPGDLDSPAFRAWVKARVKLARQYFHDGKRYLDNLDVLRCKIAGYWYCVRFECVLNAIEKEDFVLRLHYQERRKYSTWLRLVKVALAITFKHLTNRKARVRSVIPENHEELI